MSKLKIGDLCIHRHYNIKYIIIDIQQRDVILLILGGSDADLAIDRGYPFAIEPGTILYAEPSWVSCYVKRLVGPIEDVKQQCDNHGCL
jgi:hypothetical protein